jgi:hypothetical protein
MPSGFIKKLQQRWNVESAGQVVLILLVFACTGFSVMFLKKPITNWIYSNPELNHKLFSILYWVLIIPIYNFLLLLYGFIFGQFRFFWEFEKRFFNRISGRAGKQTK